MSKAGKTVLLSLLILLGFGATPQIHARETIISKALSVKSAEIICTPLTNYLVTESSSCKDRLSHQKDLAKIASVLEEEEKEYAGYSYAVEPTYYKAIETTPLPTITQTPTPSIQTPQNGLPIDNANLDSSLILSIINSHRTSLGKPVFVTDENLCTLARARSNELWGEFANGTLHSGLYNRNLPYFITEDTKWGSNEAGTVQWWLNSPVHRAAIEGDHVYSCGACSGSACAQLFTSFIPKSGLTASNPESGQTVE